MQWLPSASTPNGSEWALMHDAHLVAVGALLLYAARRVEFEQKQCSIYQALLVDSEILKYFCVFWPF
jgi:hypothetical protein